MYIYLYFFLFVKVKSKIIQVQEDFTPDIRQGTPSTQGKFPGLIMFHENRFDRMYLGIPDEAL